MKRQFLSAFFILLFVNPNYAGSLRIGLDAELTGAKSKSTIFRAEFLLPENENRELFSGPYTVEISFSEKDPRVYDFNVILYGLAPEYKILRHDFSLQTGEKMLIPVAPVKEGSSVSYIITLLDDTSEVTAPRFPLEDSALWEVSETVHYRTHWVMGSLIDFKWNDVMKYLELIYDKYRQSYGLSEFDKIDMYFHPLPTNQVYLYDTEYYSIEPESRRIDLVYNHDIKAATPAPGCELLLYRLWGYGPRWMVTGLSHYYEDNMLRIRDFVKDYDRSEILDLLKDDIRVRGKNGSIVAGALVFWLLQNESVAEFKKLYVQSTSLDFETKFGEVYKYPFDEMLERFLNYAGNYSTTISELEYFASLYFHQGNMTRAGDYYRELAMKEGANRAASMTKLATCYFWLGNYSSADSVYDVLRESGDGSPEVLFMKGEIELAEGNIDSAMYLYGESYKRGFAGGRLRNASILMDRGDFDSASSLLNSVDQDAEHLLDYMVETARLKSIRDNSADSLLDLAIRNAINMSNRNPADPRPYLILGKVYALTGDYEKSINQLNTAYFLEESPFNQSFILLEMGRTEDLLGERREAKELYRRVIELKGGRYQSMLAEKYLDSPYETE